MIASFKRIKLICEVQILRFKDVYIIITSLVSVTEVNRVERARKFGILGRSRVETLITANWILARHVSSDSCQRGVAEILVGTRYRGESIGISMRTSRWSCTQLNESNFPLPYSSHHGNYPGQG